MIHPLIKLLATRPDLLAQHLGAYADLASVEAVEVAERLRRKLVLTVALSSSAALGLGLSGIALMLWAVVPTAQMPQPWLLVAVPSVAWLTAALCWWRLNQPQDGKAFETLREQIDLDAQMLGQGSSS